MQRSRVFLVVLLSLLVGALAAQAGERRIQQSDLPPAVAKAVQSEFHGAKVSGFSEEREHGQTLYEVELELAGHSRDVLFDSTGAVVEVEEEVALDALPANVRSALEAKAGKAKISKVESLTKRGRLVAYEAQLNLAGKRSEIQVGPEGQALAHEE